jgi:hypothetical protein
MFKTLTRIKKMRRLLFLFLFVAFPFQNVLHSAEEESKISQLIEEQTIIVAQIDCTKINLPTIISEILPQENQRHVEEIAQNTKAIISKTGLKNVYVIGNIQLPILFYLAIPKEDKVDIEAINKLMAEIGFEQQFEIRETADFKLLIPSFMAPYSLRQSDDLKQITDATVPKLPVLRKEFVEASKELENYPIKISVSLPSFVKRILNETKPTFFENDKQVDFSILLNQFRWLAIGIDPKKSEIHVVTETQAENKTQDFLTELNNLIDVGFDQFIKLADSEVFKDKDYYSEWFSVDFDGFTKSIISQRKVILEFLTPKVQGKSIVFHYSSKVISELIQKLSAQIKTSITVVQDIQTRTKSKNNLKQLILAVHNYHDINNAIPPAFTVDANGKPLHSWRVLILPYIEEYAMYKNIRLNESWDSEYNKQFHDKMPAIYRSPTDQSGQKRDTVYCAIVGKDTVFKEDGKKITFNHVTDGTSNTIIFVERQTPVCWMKPEDITQEDAFKGINKGGDKGIKAIQGIMNAAFLDGSVRFLHEKKINEKVLKAYITISGGELIDGR